MVSSALADDVTDGPRGAGMNAEEKVKFCRIIGILLLSDGELADDELEFFDEMMEHLDVPKKERSMIKGSINVEYDYVSDIEALRKAGYANLLLRELWAAARADAVIKPSETIMIQRVDRIIKYRLGVKNYILPLRDMGRRPLSETYELLEELSTGVFREVFKAREKRTGQLCIVKKIAIDMISRSDEDRFWREVKLLGKLRSPHAVRIHGAGFDDDVPYMILEYLEGKTLREVLVEGPLSLSQTKSFAKQLLEGIADAHDYGIVHRDLNPANIILTGRNLDHAKILNFGIAGHTVELKEDDHFNITEDRATLGTPSYMPYEQMIEAKVARRESDIYAVGLILCECLTATPVFQGNRMAVIRAQADLESPAPLPPEVLEGPFGEIINRATQKRWYRRFGPPEGLIAQAMLLETKGTAKEIGAFYKNIYKIYSPADEMLREVDALDVSDASFSRDDAPEKQGFLKRLFRWSRPSS